MYLEHEMYEIYRLIKNKGYGRRNKYGEQKRDKDFN